MNESLSLLREEDNALLYAIIGDETTIMTNKKAALGTLLDRLVSRKITLMMLEGRIVWGENADMD